MLILKDEHAIDVLKSGNTGHLWHDFHAIGVHATDVGHPDVDSSLKKRRRTTRNVGGSGEVSLSALLTSGGLCAQAARRLVPPRYLHVVGVRNFISTNFSHSI